MAGVLIGFIIIIANAGPRLIFVAFIARAFQGFFMGALTTIAPLYIVELAPFEYRGAFGSFHQLSSAFGISYLNLLDIWCGWRLLTYLAGRSSFSSAFASSSCRSLPQWKGRNASLSRIHCARGDIFTGSCTLSPW
jgi:MFS family permease